MLIDLLRRAAERSTDRPAVVSSSGSQSYGDCLTRSEAFARGLNERGIKRFGCVLPAPEDVVVALAGSSACGSEGCVYPMELDRGRMIELASKLGHSVLVTESPADLGDVQALTVDEIVTTVSSADAPLETPAHPPVLVLTTGTTGNPRGARHDWARLVNAVRHPDPRPGMAWLLAYNLYQFGGLQVLLHALASQATLVAPASTTPQDVIAAIREHRVTHVSATPTFWRLLVGSLDPERAGELPLEQITLGGEAVQDSLIEKLRALFPQAKLSQIYGATESGTAVSVTDGRSGLDAAILDRDEGADVQLRIVDGELQMKSRIGMLGYLDESDYDGGWRPTGDLVEVHGDRIHFVGRRTEIINVGGAKVHPLPIEELAGAVEGVEMVAVYGRPNPITGQIVAVDVVAAPSADTSALEAQIRSSCQGLPRAAQPRLIRFVDSLELRGHKVARGARGEESA